MQDASVDGEKESQSNVNLGEIPVIRSSDVCVGSQNSSRGGSSGSSGVEKVGDDEERNRCEIVAREYDYVRFSNVAGHSQRREYGDLGKLGPKTKDTELRLGLPLEGERNHGGSDVPGSRRGPSMHDARSVHKDTNSEGFRGSVVGKGGNLCHTPHGQFLTGEVGLEQSRFLAGAELHGRGHSSQSQEELKQKMGFQEFTGRELPFDIRFSQQERWAKPMMVVPPLNSYYRTEDRRAISSGGKRIFSDTLPGSPSVTPQLDLPKLPFSHSQLRMPHSTFTFPFAGGPNLMWDSPQGKSKLANFPGHMGAKFAPPLTSEMRIECVGEASSSQLPQQVPPGLPTLATSENKSSQAQAGGARNREAEQSGPRAAPVVGWPPIRSFRKNLASQPKAAPNPPPAPSPPPALAPAPSPAPAPDPMAADPVGKKNSRTMFVKVNMEGVPIGRKIDLKAYDSYEKLYVALDEMFRGSIPAQKSGPNPTSENKEPSVLSGRDFVVVYEDDEGDRMLVGDVPWEMFVSTVKRLRVIKSSEARGLAAKIGNQPRQSIEWPIQKTNGKPKF